MLTLNSELKSLLRFDEKKHKYVLKDKILISVTQLINNFTPESNFNNWYKSLGDNYAKENNIQLTTEEALLIGKKLGNNIKTEVGSNGRKVHKHIENYYLGTGSIEELGRFNSLPKNSDIEYDCNSNPFVETIVYNKGCFDYAGTVDAVMVTKTDSDC